MGHTVPSYKYKRMIAATASRHSLIIVTRNTADFEKSGIKTLNPFL